MPTKELYGRYLEEFTEGEIIEHWPDRTITEAMNDLFCSITGNFHPLHTDSVYAEGSQFGQRVVLGPLVYSFVFGMTVAVVSGKAIANLATDKLRHPNPVLIGDTLHARTTVLTVRESRSQPHRGIVTVKTEGINQRGEVVIEFERTVMVPKRPSH